MQPIGIISLGIFAIKSYPLFTDIGSPDDVVPLRFTTNDVFVSCFGHQSDQSSRLVGSRVSSNVGVLAFPFASAEQTSKMYGKAMISSINETKTAFRMIFSLYKMMREANVASLSLLSGEQQLCET